MGSTTSPLDETITSSSSSSTSSATIIPSSMRFLSAAILALAAFAAAVASPIDGYGHVDHHKGYKPPPKPYSFSYGVEDPHYGPTFQQKEKSDGNAVSGSYTVQLPDGRLQKVTYTADHDTGFHANVEYKGKAQYPSKVGPPFIVKPDHHPEPTYH